MSSSSIWQYCVQVATFVSYLQSVKQDRR